MLGIWAYNDSRTWLSHLEKHLVELTWVASAVSLSPNVRAKQMHLVVSMCIFKNHFWLHCCFTFFSKELPSVHSQFIQHGSAPICCQPQYDLSLYYRGQNVRINFILAPASQIFICSGSPGSHSNTFHSLSRVCAYRCFIHFFFTCGKSSFI